MQLTIDQVITRIAARRLVTLARAAELLQADPELVFEVAGGDDPPGIQSDSAFEDPTLPNA